MFSLAVFFCFMVLGGGAEVGAGPLDAANGVAVELHIGAGVAVKAATMTEEHEGRRLISQR